ncbi:MAG: NlpC/P60 family protein [Chlamydiota bacterium]
MNPVTSIKSLFFYSAHPLLQIKELPSSQSKVVSQALFGEPIRIEEETKNWVQIITPDGYKGWVDSKFLIKREKIYCPLEDESLKTSRIAAHIYLAPDIEYGPSMTLPYGSRLQKIEDCDSRWVKIELPNGQESYIQRGDITPEESIQDPLQLLEFSKKFLGVPYTWGGRSSFGFDCSGFIQMLYAQIGMKLPRDSHQQIKDQQLTPIPWDELKPTDLVFWGKSPEKIMHLGMCLGGGSFIHASSRENQPYVRISKFSDSEWSGKSDAYYSFRAAYKRSY